MSTISTVTFEGASGRVVVERAQRITKEVAQNTLYIMCRSYSRQFEGPQTEANLPEGTFQKYFHPQSVGAVVRQQERMETAVANGARYWFARYVELEDEPFQPPPSGLVKVSPSRPNLLQKAGLAAPNLFVNDLAVEPGSQGAHLGSKLFYSVVTFGEHRKTGPVSLDAYVANPRVNAWYASLGFVLRSGVNVEPLALPDELTLEEVRLEAPSGATVANALIQQVPDMRFAKAE